MRKMNLYFLVRFNDQKIWDRVMGEWFGGDREERTRRCKLQYALALCVTVVTVWMGKNRAARPASARDWRNAFTRVRALVRRYAKPRNTDGRTGWRTMGRPGQPAVTQPHTLAHVSYEPTLPLHLIPLFLHS